MKKLTLILMSVLVLGLASCQKEVVEKFDKPTDVVNPNPPAPPTVYEYGLKDLALRSELLLGTAFTRDEYFKNDSVPVLLARDFSVATFGNEMKHDAIVQANGKMKFDTADEMLGWADECGIEVFGHNLGWHQQQQITYLNSLLDKSSADNSASLFQDNWNFESGEKGNYTFSDVEICGDPNLTFAGDYAALFMEDDASLTTPDIAVTSGKPYIISFWAQGLLDAVPFKVASCGKEVSGESTLDWQKYSVTFKAKEDVLNVVITGGESLCVDNIRVIETEEEEPEEPGGNFINPNTIVENGDFETFELGAIGQGGWSAMNGSDVLSITDEITHSGARALKMDNSADYAGASSWKIQAASPTFDIDPTKTYRVAWYGKADVEDVDIQIDVRWAVSNTGYYSTTYNQLGASKVNEDWQYFYVDLTPADAGDNTMQVVFYGGCSVATYYIDDFQIFEAVTEGDYTNYIEKTNMLGDADFEGNSWGVWNGADYASIVHRNYVKDEEGKDVVSIDANKDKVHSALHSLVIDNSSAYCSGGDGWKIQVANSNVMDVVAGEEYRIGFWAKSPDGYTTLQIEGKWDTGTNYWQLEGITDEWTYVYFDKVAPEEATTLQIVLDAGYSVGTAYIDDFQVYPKPVESYIDPASVITNGDFEDVTDDWCTGITRGNGGEYITLETTNVHSGKYAIKVDNSGPYCTGGDAWKIQFGNAWNSPETQIEGGKTYRYGVWVMSPDAVDGATIQLYAKHYSDETTATGTENYRQVSFEGAANQWQFLYTDIEFAEDVTCAQLTIQAGYTQGTFYFDDWQCFPVEASKESARMAAGFGKYGDGWVRPAPGAGFVRSDVGVLESTDKLDGELAEECIDRAYKNYVYGMVGHFDVYGWDVINEALTDGGNWRTSENTPDEDVFIWGDYYEGGHKEWAQRGFLYAKDALEMYGKEADLYINDYNLETSSAKLKAICEFAKGNDNVTGVGSQMHLTLNPETVDDLKDGISTMLDEMVATGKKVRISELDIAMGNGAVSSEQADLYVYVIDEYLAKVPAEQRGGITIWGINDKDSWLGESSAPLLWKGTKYEKKDAYEQIYLYLKDLVVN